MPDFTWMAQEERLTPAALTVQAQTVDPTDSGQLLWNVVMPRRNVDQMRLQSLTSRNVRIVSDRREWNMRGRYIPLFTPRTREMEWIPIEAYFRLEEEEINRVMLEVRGNQQLFRQVIGVTIPARTDELVQANYRRLELDCFSSWTLGRIDTMNPQTGATNSAVYGFDTGRYQNAAVAWNDPSVNAYQEFLAWWADARVAVGPLAGAMMRSATRRAIQMDAPNPMPGAQTGLTTTIVQVEQRIQDETGAPFRFILNENTVEPFTGPGVARQQVHVWPDHVVAAVPQNGRIGTTAFAPVIRAYDLTSQVPNAGIDIRGQTIYHEVANGGREIIIEGQFNPMPDPDETKIFVMNAGV